MDTWNDRYDKEHMPGMADMAAYIQSPLWDACNAYLQEAYQAAPKLTHSTCSGQPGWNVKYAKGGKALCTLYPMAGHFIALVVVGPREQDEAERLMPGLAPGIQALYASNAGLMGARWLMIPVTEEAILRDSLRLVALRRKPTMAYA